jgi:hypothetical protein
MRHLRPIPAEMTMDCPGMVCFPRGRRQTPRPVNSRDRDMGICLQVVTLNGA